MLHGPFNVLKNEHENQIILCLLTALTAMKKKKFLCLFSLKKCSKFLPTKQKQFRKLRSIQKKYSLHSSAICLEYLAVTSVHKQLFSFLQLMDQKVQDHNKAAGNLHEFLYWLKKRKSILKNLLR